MWLNFSVRCAHAVRSSRLHALAFIQLRWLWLIPALALAGWVSWRTSRTTSQSLSLPPTNVPAVSLAPAAPAPIVRSNAPSGQKFSQEVFEAQLALVRRGISSGSLDGVIGFQTRAALRAFQESEGWRATGEIDAATSDRLASTVPLYVAYMVTADDLARLQPIGKTWLAKSQQNRLEFETLLELAAELGHAHPGLVRRLNPDIDWANVAVGTTVRIPNAEYPAVAPRAAQLKIFVGNRILEAFDSEGRLLAHFPCSIAQRVEKRPVGETLRVSVLAPNPNYTFDPDVFPESAEARELGRKLILPPGPNNPVGTVWIGLDKPGYGIHGTPRPEEVGRTESHGCFRLANWNAEYLLKLVWVGVPVGVEP